MSGLELDGVVSLASERLGYPDLRPKQRLAIRSFVEGNVALPTGSEKSLCYAVLPFAFDAIYQREGSMVLVISPLVALMKDQVGEVETDGAIALLLYICEGNGTNYKRLVSVLYNWGDKS